MKSHLLNQRSSPWNWSDNMVNYKFEPCFSIIRQAMTQVSPSYILLKTAGSNPNYRERVYCYELYHQMRCLQEQNSQAYNFVINGEIDKRGHRLITEKFNPDFVMHDPGSMENNTCVVEVKTRSNSKYEIHTVGLRKDLKTITCMLHCYGYHFGALIYVGVSEEKATSLLYSADIPHLNDIADRVAVFFQSKQDPKNIKVEFLKEILERKIE